MTNAPIRLQDLRRSLYVKAKAEPNWRFWGLYVHVCKRETLYEAYRMAKENGGAPGIDGVTFEAIEESGVESFLRQIRDELITSVTGRDLLPVRVRLFPDYFLSLGAAFPLLTYRLRTVLAVKGSLRRAKCGRALDRSGPLWNAS